MVMPLVIDPKDALLESLRKQLQMVDLDAVQVLLKKMKEVTILKANLLSKVDEQLAKTKAEVEAPVTPKAPQPAATETHGEVGTAKGAAVHHIPEGGPLPKELMQRLGEVLQRISRGLVERGDESQMVLLAALSGEHLLLLGPPGTAKSELARRLSSVFTGGGYFERLLTKFSSPEELFGPLSIRKLEEDCYERMVTGYLPEASVAFIDEIFKANSAILNTLLSIMNERMFHNGSQPRDAPLVCLVGASNEMPESDELEALFDRFLLRRWVPPLSGDGFMSYLEGMSGNAELQPVLPPPSTATISHEDIRTVRRCASRVEIPDAVMDRLLLIRHFTATLTEPTCYVSDRRWKKIMYLLQVLAATSGRTSVAEGDLLMLRHCLWSHPSHLPLIGEFITNMLDQSDRSGPVMDTKTKKPCRIGSCVYPKVGGRAGLVLSATGAKVTVVFVSGKGASMTVEVREQQARALVYCRSDALYSTAAFETVQGTTESGIVVWSEELRDQKSLRISENGTYLTQPSESEGDYHTALCEPEMSSDSGVYMWEVTSENKASNVKVGLCRPRVDENWLGNMYEAQCERSKTAIIYYNEGQVFVNLEQNPHGDGTTSRHTKSVSKWNTGHKIKFTFDTSDGRLVIECNGSQVLVLTVNLDEPVHFFACTDYDGESFRITASEHEPPMKHMAKSVSVPAAPVPAAEAPTPAPESEPTVETEKAAPKEPTKLLGEAVKLVLQASCSSSATAELQASLPLLEEACTLLLEEYCIALRLQERHRFCLRLVGKILMEFTGAPSRARNNLLPRSALVVNGDARLEEVGDGMRASLAPHGRALPCSKLDRLACRSLFLAK
ncbi:hypothetical protein CYMTET_44196 [Cymbomonas tetramitiformis]|uniref:AAA+ ATPase domain-containing protein n=1 Tax=Cymbomonas tetramitiformis TaxID=36881 RepID=A0AAE0C2S3_9CHLO|nr:hypothetical protein CYMTET_44196 [Cymbomonas tetramitiformis]